MRPDRSAGIHRRWRQALVWALLCATPGLRAAERSAAVTDREPMTFWRRLEEKGLYERIWERLRLVEAEDARFVQALSVIGRYHGQYWNVNADEGSDADWENRRLYLGLEARVFQDFTVQAQMKVSEDFDPFYEGLYQAFVEWEPGREFALSLGRLDFLFAGLERSTSSTRIPVFERGLLVNQLLPGEVVGALAAGRPGRFTYHAGVFSGSIEQEFTHFDGGVGFAAGVGHELRLFHESGRLHLDWVCHDGNDANNAFEPWDHVLSLWHEGRSGPLGLGVDLTLAHGLDGRPGVLGVTVLPTCQIATNVVRRGDALVAVLRYQCAFSDGDDGLALQPRYEQKVVPGGAGDRYHAFYGGLNYLLFGDRLKLMTGVEWSEMSGAADGGGYRGWTWLSGIRVHF